MIKEYKLDEYKRLTHEKRFEHYRSGERVPAVTIDTTILGDPYVVCIEEPNDYDIWWDHYYPEHRLTLPEPNRFVAGPIVDRLFAYEELGYSPEELAEIIRQNNEIRKIVEVQTYV